MAALVCTVIVIKSSKRNSAPSNSNPSPPAKATAPRAELPSGELTPAASAKSTRASRPRSEQTSDVQNQNPPLPKQRQDPLARVALGFVGADPDAESYWVDAIFDPNLSNREREDLMEDLNEVGLSNPRQPAPEDFPLIMNRIALIEQIVPYADPFMQEHLGEAYKDLVGLLDGRPPQ